MSNSISDLKTAGVGNSSAKLDGIQFNKIQKTGYNSVAKYVLKDAPWYTLDPSTPVKPAVNAVDIDWNAAVIPYGNLENGDSATVNSTGELLSLISQISKMQQVAHYTVSDINSSPKNFYNDLVSNKKVYIGDNPVFYYKISGDTNAKTIVAYTFADHMGIPYAVKYNIPITITSGSSGDVWECTGINGFNIYNYFSPIVLIDVDVVDSTTLSFTSIDIKVGEETIAIPIDEYATFFLQSCDIWATYDGDYYWRLNSRNLKYENTSVTYISKTIYRYMHMIDNNSRYKIDISWDMSNINNNTLTTLATLI